MEQYANKVRIAAHRGNSQFFPENTIIAYQSALSMPIDQVEIDLHMTKDGHIVMMHDHCVDRTTDGTGRIKEKTLKEMLALDAGSYKGEQFKGTKVPMFEEFLDLCKQYPNMTVNVELKDYPNCDGNDFAWAKTSTDKILKMLEDAHMRDRIWINSWCGEQLEYIDREYGHRYRLHGYFPRTLMFGRQEREPYTYLHCACLFGDAKKPLRDKADFDYLLQCGVEPWCCFDANDYASVDGAIENGCMLFTTNDPAGMLEHLRAKGLHM